MRRQIVDRALHQLDDSSAQSESSRESRSQLPVQVRPPPSPAPRSCAARALSANLERCSSGFEISMPGNWCRAETMRNCAKPLDKSPVRDPRHRSECAQASARSCKGNQTGAWPTLRTLPTVDLSCEDEVPNRTIPLGPNPIRLHLPSPESLRPSFELLVARVAWQSDAPVVRRQLTENSFHISGSLS